MDQWIYERKPGGGFIGGMTIKDDYRTLEGYRLPSDEEWEYACRAGSSSRYSCGEPVSLLHRYAQNSLNSQGHSHVVGSLLPNSFGLFDMHGNLWEWCQDAGKGPLSPVKIQSMRALRGGSFGIQPFSLRSNRRSMNPPAYKDFYTGFRTARSLP